MKRILGLITLVCLFGLTSCQKVIDLDLNSEDPKYVVEGTVTKDSTVHTVKITRTLNFDENTAYPTVDNAIVTITDNLGNATTLTLVSPGVYQTANYPGIEGRTYTINVSVDGKNFSSSSTMPVQVPIDSLTLEEFSFDPETPFYALVANRKDPAGIKNYYRFDLYRGSERFDGIYLQNDQFADGVEVLEPIFGGDYASGDTAFLEMMCIDAAAYKYFYTLSVNAGGTGGAVPANPDSNFGSQCLGYFSAQTFERRMKIIP
ncbi:MAG: hypothetical protein K0R65_2234 [Crocinitomicaceae bacterium]|jgi:hypothetical protein|nr:hypothetical protein [Crocinitomicaceae bacterium]